jgi:hypothetical protein
MPGIFQLSPKGGLLWQGSHQVDIYNLTYSNLALVTTTRLARFLKARRIFPDRGVLRGLASQGLLPDLTGMAGGPRCAACQPGRGQAIFPNRPIVVASIADRTGPLPPVTGFANGPPEFLA